MKRLLTLLFAILSLQIAAQTQSSLPSGSVPYGSVYLAPDGSVWAGATGKTFKKIGLQANLTALNDSITNLRISINGKVDKMPGKGLSTEDYTTPEKSKLAGIAAGAEVNVNADWLAVSGDAQILNKPTFVATESDPVFLAQKGAVNGVATLNSSGKIPNAQIPALALVDTYVTASQAAMLALSTAEQGDVAIRTDVSKTFILTDNNYSTLASWSELLSPIIPAETDPIWGASPSAGITGTDISNWNTAYGWGNHSGLYLPVNNPTYTGTIAGPGAIFSGDVGVAKSSPVSYLQNSTSITTGSRGDLAWYNSSVSTVALIRAAAVTDNVGTGLEFYTRPAGGSLANTISITPSGTLASLMGNNQRIFTSSSATTGYQYFQMQNSGANFLWGIDGSISGSLATGSAAYSTVLTSVNATSLHLGTNQIVRYTIDASGNNTWTGTGVLGEAKIGTWSYAANYARFGHSNFDGNATYGYLQHSTGDLYMNGTNVYISATSNINIALSGSGDRLISINGSNNTSGVTIGSGLSLSGGVLSATGGTSGTGTAGYIPKWNSSSDIGNSVILESSSNIGIGGSPDSKFNVYTSGVYGLRIGYSGTTDNYFDGANQYFRSETGTSRLTINSSGVTATGLVAAASFSGAGSGLTGTASSLTAGAIVSQANSATITASSAATASTIVQRDVNGYIFGSYANFTSGAGGGAPVRLVGKNSGSDYYYDYTAANIQSFLGLGSAAYTASSAYYAAGSTVANSTLWAGFSYAGLVVTPNTYMMAYDGSNWGAATVSSIRAMLSVPTLVSQLTNDSGFITSSNGVLAKGNLLITGDGTTTVFNTGLSGGTAMVISPSVVASVGLDYYLYQSSGNWYIEFTTPPSNGSTIRYYAIVS